MSNTSNDYIRFNAYSIKELITRKLCEDSKFTDQVYEGSNLAILIDLVSYMYQCLMFQLNNAASESMFSDTQIYENINRLVRLIGYHPQGCKPSQIRLNRYTQKTDEYKTYLYPCTIFDTGIQKNGKNICFSTDFNSSQYVWRANDDESTRNILYNGIWKKYGSVFIANGYDYETFILPGVCSNKENDQYVAFQHIKIIVQDKDGKYDRDWVCDNNEIFLQAVDINITDNARFAKIYSGNESKVYTVYLDEDKQYVIKFGNGIIGRKLTPGDKVHVFYLDTNGEDGNIDVGDIDFSNLQVKRGFDGQINWDQMWENDSDLMTAIYAAQNKSEYEENSITESSSEIDWSRYLQFYGVADSKTEETQDEIRENAPNWFKQGNRLITKQDYQYFFKNYQSGIVDVKCMNNWDYMTTFYRWLYNFGINPNKFSGRTSNPYQFLEKYRLINNGFNYVDAADANNIYLWIKMTDETDNLQDIKSKINDEINLIKTMTSEIYPLKPIDVYFDISFTPEEVYYDCLGLYGDCSFDYKYSYVEITMTDNSVFSNTTIKNRVCEIIKNYFNAQNCRIGQNVDYGEILNKIYEINGVERVRTVFNPIDTQGDSDPIIRQYNVKTRCCDGLSFASWSQCTEIVPIGEDINVNNTSRNLEQFQFPQLAPYTRTNLSNKIKIIKKTMNTTNPIKF